MLIGRLTKDPELKFTPGESNTAVTTFSLAINWNFKNKEGNYDADFVNVVVWGKLAETVANNLKKGRQAAVAGRLQVRNYEANDGTKRYVTEVVASEVQFLDPKDKAINNAASQDNDFPPIDEGDNDLPF
jgi:single-strand DNA-binding protein